MTKFSNFIRNPGTAGPPTVEGISALGFVLNTDVPGFLTDYVRVDAAQSFNSGEKAQGRSNISAQEFSASLTSLAGLTTAADRLAYTTASDTWAVTTLTAFARTILDDANAAAVRTTIELGNVNNTSDANKPVSTAQQAALDLKANLASPPLTGVPTAPTAPAQTDSTQLANAAFVAGEKIIRQAFSVTDTTSVTLSAADTGINVTLPANLKSTSSKVRIRMFFVFGAVGEGVTTFEVRRNTASILPAGVNCHAVGYVATTNGISTVAIEVVDSPGVTTPPVYRLYQSNVAGGATTRYLGRRGADTVADAPILITIEELVNVT